MIDLGKYDLTYRCQTMCLGASYAAEEPPTLIRQNTLVCYEGEEEIGDDTWFTVLRICKTKELLIVPSAQFHMGFILEQIDEK